MTTAYKRTMSVHACKTIPIAASEHRERLTLQLQRCVRVQPFPATTALLKVTIAAETA